jgi:D-serine deaminase-like pyridoxal phosphate-dependent protein
LVNLAAHTEVIVAVDSFENVRELSAAAQAGGVTLRVVVDVNIGHNRCGVAPLGPAVELSQAVHHSQGLDYSGLMGYDGHCTLGVSDAERPGCSQEANRLLARTRRLAEEAGLPVEVVSAGGTFTYQYAAEIDGITEIQAGTYLLMDTAFAEHGLGDFRCPLTVLTTVISRPSYPGAENLAVIDLGSKGISSQLGTPEIMDPDGAVVIRFSQEHGRVDVTHAARDLQIGDRVELWVRDSNGTINLFDRFYAMRGPVVEAVWDIPAPGNRT